MITEQAIIRTLAHSKVKPEFVSTQNDLLELIKSRTHTSRRVFELYIKQFAIKIYRITMKCAHRSREWRICINNTKIINHFVQQYEPTHEECDIVYYFNSAIEICMDKGYRITNPCLFEYLSNCRNRNYLIEERLIKYANIDLSIDMLAAAVDNVYHGNIDKFVLRYQITQNVIDVIVGSRYWLYNEKSPSYKTITTIITEHAQNPTECLFVLGHPDFTGPLILSNQITSTMIRKIVAKAMRITKIDMNQRNYNACFDMLLLLFNALIEHKYQFDSDLASDIMQIMCFYEYYNESTYKAMINACTHINNAYNVFKTDNIVKSLLCNYTVFHHKIIDKMYITLLEQNIPITQAEFIGLCMNNKFETIKTFKSLVIFNDQLESELKAHTKINGFSVNNLLRRIQD